MTNVPGPRQKLYFAGSGINHMMFWVPQSGRLALGLSILSYNDQVMVGVATDAGLIPDPDAIIDAFHEELEGLTARVRDMVHDAARQFRLSDDSLVSPVPRAPEPATDGLLRVKGIGPYYAQRLGAAGITSMAELANSSPEALEAICESDLLDYQAWIEQAQSLRDPV
jgi:predicted flap endonuclease-1-like 5' DNA nuclease